MGKRISLLPINVTFLLIILSFFSYHSSFSQCINPIPTGNSSQAFCKTENSTVASLVATGGTIVWFKVPSGGEQLSSSEPLINGSIYYGDDISGGNCSTNRLAVTVSIYGNIPSNVDVFVGKCALANPTISDLNATGKNIQWYDAQTGGNLLSPFELLVHSKTYWVQQTENGCTSDRFPTTVNLIDPITPVVEPIQSFCYPPNPTIADLKPSGTSIIWYEFETSTTPLKATTPLIDGKDYWAAQTTFPCESSIRAQTTVVLATAPNAGNDGSYIECEANLTTKNLFEFLGGSPDATGIWTGPSELGNGYLGTFEPGTNTEGVYTYTVASSSDICPSASANITVLITVIPPPSTTEVTQTFCEIKNATISDLSALGNGILWYDTETDTTPLNSSDLLVNGQDYWAAQTDATTGCMSISRLVVNVSIISPPPPTTSEQNQAFCEIDKPTIANLSASGNDILWYASETDTTPLNSADLLINGEDYWAAQTDATSGCESASRLVVNVTITPPTPPSTTVLNKTFCEIDKPTVNGLNSNGNSFQWYDTETSTTPLNTNDLLINGEDYWATQTTETPGCISANRIVVNVSIISPLPPTTSNLNQSFCENENATISDLSANGNGILWYATETSTTPLNADDLLTNSEDYWASQTDTTSGCESVSRLVVSVSINSTPPPTTIVANQSFCIKNYLPGSPTISELNISGNGVRWYATENSTIPLNTNDLLINGEDYWATQTNEITGCESVSRLEVNVSLVDPPTPTASETTQIFCKSNNPKVVNLQTNSTAVLWYANINSSTPLNTSDLLIDGEDYWASETNLTTGCESRSRLKVIVSIIDISPATITNVAQSFCASDFPTIENLEAVGAGIIWYASETASSPLPPATLLMNGAHYWAAQSNSTTTCASSTRVSVTVSITDLGTPAMVSLGNEFCSINNPTVADLNANVSPVHNGTITWYDSYPNGNLLNLSELLIDEETYYAVETNNSDCASVNPLEVTVTLNACNDYDIEIYDGFSPTENGINDSFKIKNLRELYPDFKIEFYNRWGNLMYTASSEKPDWNGRLNGNGELSPSGVYYFIIYFNKNNRQPIQRSLYLSR